MHEEERPGLSRSLFRAASIISIAAISSRILGYVRESLLAARFGASGVTDAYVVAQDLPLTLNLTLIGALISVFIPVYRDTLQRRGQAAGTRLTNIVLNVALLAAGAITLLGVLGAPVVVRFLVPGFSPELKELTVSLMRLAMPALLFLAGGGVISALLNAHRRFTGPALVGVAQNLAVITALWFAAGPADVWQVALAVMVGAAASVLIQLPWARGLPYRYQPEVDLGDPSVRQLGRMLLPIMVSFGVQQVQIVVDRILASGLAEGSIAALNFANRINALPYGVIGIAVTTVLFPGLSELGAARKYDELRETVSSGIRTLAFILVPMAVGVLVFREPIIELIFERGAFDDTGTAMTARALQMYAVGILFMGWMDMLNRSFYALQDAKTPMLVAVGAVALNVALNLVLIRPLGHAGLALGTALATMASALTLLYLLRRRLGRIDGAALLRSLSVSLAGSLAGAALGWLAMRAGAWLLPAGMLTDLLLLGTALGLVVICHVGLAIGLKTPDGAEVRRRLLGRLRRR